MMQKSFNNWQKVADSIRPAGKLVIKKTAFDGEAQVKAQITANDQVATGFMRSSVYVVLSDQSTYKGGQDALAQVARPTNELEAIIAVAAYYAIIQEFGSIYQPGRPFFKPSMERVRASFDKAMLLPKQKMEEAAKG
jgi:hypothetical protein